MFFDTVLKGNGIVQIMNGIATGQPRCPPTVGPGRDDRVFAEGESGHVVTGEEILRCDDDVRVVA